MLHIHLNDIVEVDEKEIAQHLHESGPELRLTLRVRDQYRAGSKTELAENWLKTWYIAESLASHAAEWHCEFEEGDEGAGDFEFRFTVHDPKGMAKAIADFAPVFDPDDLETGALVYDEAHDWLEKRHDAKVRFPALEESYRGDAEMAREYEGYMEAAGEDEELD